MTVIYLFIYIQHILLILDTHAVYTWFLFILIQFLTYHGLQNNIQVKYFHIPQLRDFIQPHPQR